MKVRIIKAGDNKVVKHVRKALFFLILVGITYICFPIFNISYKRSVVEVSNIGHIGDSVYEDTHLNEDEIGEENYFIPTYKNVDSLVTLEDLQKYLYNIDKTAFVTSEDLNIRSFLSENFKTELNGEQPRILIFHTHSQENFIDSEKSVESDTVVGVGTVLADILANKYGIAVVHDTGKYDFVDGKENREKSYKNMEPAVKKLLEKYPTVEIAIDIHRDGVSKDIKFVTDIEGRSTAKIMFFNGITRVNKNGTPEVPEDLINPYIQKNLALSLQMQLTANKLYPGITRKIYIKPYRYSLHLLPKSILVEVGANTNTVDEAKNAMYPLAEILVETLDAK